MTGGPLEAKLNDFSPSNKTADKTTVLGTDSTIGTEVGTIQWHQVSQTIENLVTFRNSINSGSVRDLATDWSNHGAKLSALAANFSNEVTANIIDSWDSTGGAVASTAVQRYAEQLAQLPGIMNAIASSLNFSAKFLDDTRNNIPDEYGLLADEIGRAHV